MRSTPRRAAPYPVLDGGGVGYLGRGGGVWRPGLRRADGDGAEGLYLKAEILRLIRLRTFSAHVRGEPPGPEASIRKALVDEHGQHVMSLARDLAGAAGMLADPGPLGEDGGMWGRGFAFAPALIIGGGTAAVQRNIVAERVLGLPHDPDVERSRSWAEARARAEAPGEAGE